MKWMTAILIGAIIAVVLPMSLGGSEGVWATSWANTGTIKPFANSPGLMFSIPLFLLTAIGFRMFFSWHDR